MSLHSAEVGVTSSLMLYGLYLSVQSAQKSLRRIADDHRLCYSRWAGAFARGTPVLPSHAEVVRGGMLRRREAGRARGAVAVPAHQPELSTWPLHERIALEEKGDGLRHFHVLDAWHYLGPQPWLQSGG